LNRSFEDSKILLKVEKKKFGKGNMMSRVWHILQLKGSDIWSVSPDDTVYNALRLMSEKKIGAVMVMQDEGLIGIFSERDYARKIILKERSSRDTPVRDVMSPYFYPVHPSQTSWECLELMSEKDVKHLPVMLNDKLLGVISMGDAARDVIYEQRKAIHDLENRVIGKSFIEEESKKMVVRYRR
jgi:CBS domain-containing protein